MRKIIDIEEPLLVKLKIISAFENSTVKALMEKAVEQFVAKREKERLDAMSEEDAAAEMESREADAEEAADDAMSVVEAAEAAQAEMDAAE